MNKKGLFTNGPDWADFKTIVAGIQSGVTSSYTFNSVEEMKSHWLGTPEVWDDSKIYRITIEEVNKDGSDLNG